MAPPKAGGKQAAKGPVVPLNNGISVTKEANFSQWYQEVVTKCEMVDYYTEVSWIGKTCKHANQLDF